MRQLFGWVLVIGLIGGCVTYFRGERYSCFSPSGVDKCKSPPYHAPSPVPDDNNY